MGTGYTNGTGPRTPAPVSETVAWLRKGRPVEIGGRTYTLRLSMSAMCACESVERNPDGSRVTFHEIAARAGRYELTAIRLMVWGVLQAHHPELTLEDAGELFLLAKAEGIDMLKVAAEDGVPEAEDVATLEAGTEKTPNPRRRRGRASLPATADGIGGPSTGAVVT